MNTASLTVYGADRALAEIRDALPSEPASDWRKGEPRANGHVHLDSGFEVRIAATENPGALAEQIRAYLEECASRGITFAVPRIVAELRIGIGAAQPQPQPGRDGIDGIDFTLADLNTLTEMGVCLSLVAG